MPINPNIALSAVPVKIDVPDPMEMYARMAQVQQARNQNALAQYQLSKAQREDERAAGLNRLVSQAVTPEGTVDYNKLISAAGAQGYGSLVPDFIKAQREGVEAQAKADKEFGAAVEQRLKLSREMLSNVTTPEEFMALHKANHRDPVLKKFFGQLGITEESARPGIEKAIAEGPEAFEKLLYRSRASADSLVKHFEEQRKPTELSRLIRERDALPENDPRRAAYDDKIAKETKTPLHPVTATTGTNQLFGAMNTLTGKTEFTTSVEQGLTPFQQKQVEHWKQQLEKQGADLSPEQSALVSRAILDGRLDPNRVNSKNAKIIASTLAAQPDADLRNLALEATTETASARTLGTISANVVTAAAEAEKMIPIAQGYIAKIQPSDYPLVNKAGLYIAKNTGDPNQAGLASSLNALVNTYARAINPRGVPTVSDKNHAREVIDAAMSQGQLAEVFSVMQQEMQAAQAAPKEARGKLFTPKGGASSAGAGRPSLDEIFK